MSADPAIDALWKRVLDNWDDDGVHGAFLEYCERTDCLVEAAVRYRGMAADRQRSEAAQTRLRAISVIAFAKLEAARTPQRQARRHATRVLGFVLLLAALGAVLIHLGRLLE